MWFDENLENRTQIYGLERIFLFNLVHDDLAIEWIRQPQSKNNNILIMQIISINRILTALQIDFSPYKVQFTKTSRITLPLLHSFGWMGYHYDY
jgi:hypothetical protein